MIRLVAWLALLILVGAGLNLAVAWAACLWARPVDQAAEVMIRFADPGVTETIYQPPEAERWLRPIYEQMVRGGFHIEQVRGAMLLVKATRSRARGLELWAWMAPRAAASTSLAGVRAGWPWRSFECRGSLTVGLTSMPPLWSGALEPPDWLRPRNSRAGVPRMLPCGPIPSGVVAGSTFYASILFVLWSVPRQARRSWRHRRGRCPACGYPIGTTDVCSECGKPVTPRPASPPTGTRPRTPTGNR
jgi:hypothetical protein